MGKALQTNSVTNTITCVSVIFLCRGEKVLKLIIFQYTCFCFEINKKIILKLNKLPFIINFLKNMFKMLFY